MAVMAVMPEAPRICVVGSINTDLTVRTRRLPQPGETLAGRAFAVTFGGKGANQAVMAARLGARVSMIGRVGRDAFGDQAVANLRKEDIDTRHVAVDETSSSGIASIAVDDAAQNAIIVVPGANAAVAPAGVGRAITSIQEAQILICQLEVPIDTVLAAFRAAKAAGVATILNPAPAPAAELPSDLLRLTDICVPNESELALLSGRTLSTSADIRSAGRQLCERGVATVIVTLGADGALLLHGNNETHIAAPAVRAVDTTGAGDAFIGSLAVFLAQGHMPLDAVKRANAVAALSVTKPGAQASFPSRQEVQDLLGGMA